MLKVSYINIAGHLLERVLWAEREWARKNEILCFWVTAVWPKNIGNNEDEEMDRELAKGGFP